MVVAFVATACLGIALPLAVLFAGRRRQARWLSHVGGLGPPTDAADRLLIERHHLPALRRREVRQAVIFGRALPDERERAAVRDLAAAALDGHVVVGRGTRAALRVLLAVAAVLITAGALVTARLSPAGVGSILLGVLNAIWAGTGIRAVHGGPLRALQRNQ